MKAVNLLTFKFTEENFTKDYRKVAEILEESTRRSMEMLYGSRDI